MAVRHRRADPAGVPFVRVLCTIESGIRAYQYDVDGKPL